MAVKAKLQVVLKADDLVVAESEDEALWRAAFDAIIAGRPLANSPAQSAPLVPTATGPAPAGSRVEVLASELGLDVSIVDGACGPFFEAPYIHLNPHNFEALKKNTPQRGSGSIPATILAATLLALWFRAADLGQVKVDHIHDVLRTLGLADKNAPRALKNCPWFTMRGESIVVLNPAEITRAVAVARAYCTKSKLEIG